MKNGSLLNNEKGSMILIVVLLVTSVSAIFVLSFMQNFDGINSLHKRKRELVDLRPQMRKMAKQFRHAYDAGQLDSSCASTPGFIPRKINGVDFCFPLTNKFCYKLSDAGGRGSEYCIPTDPISLNWRNGISSFTISVIESENSETIPPEERSNSITIPSPTSASGVVWRSCTTANTACLRLLLCEEGVTCNAQNASAIQVMRIGTLN